MTPARDSAETDLLHALVLHRYGDRLSAEQVAALRGEVEALVELATALRRVPLGNADEPAAPFTPYRADG